MDGHWGVKVKYGDQGRQEGRLLIGFTEPGVGPMDEDSVSGTERTVCMAALRETQFSSPLPLSLSRTDYGRAARITVQNQGEGAGLNWSGSLPGRWLEISRPGCGATW